MDSIHVLVCSGNLWCLIEFDSVKYYTTEADDDDDDELILHCDTASEECVSNDFFRHLLDDSPADRMTDVQLVIGRGGMGGVETMMMLFGSLTWLMKLENRKTIE